MIPSSSTLKKRKAGDLFKVVSSYLFSSFGILILAAVIIFVFSKGSGVLSWKFLTSDYNSTTATVSYLNELSEAKTFVDPAIDKVYFSSAWGVGFEDSYDAAKEPCVIVSYLDNNSPMKNLIDGSSGNYFSLTIGEKADSGVLLDQSGQAVFAMGKDGAAKMAAAFDQGVKILSLAITTLGGGIRGSLLTTLYMILLTLLIALPLGVLAALYFNQYAKENRLNKALKAMIEAAGGIPSIIYGLIGALLFIPLVNRVTGQKGGSIISGALTLAIMLLPVVISSTEESLKAIPSSLEAASLALGASKTQTVFKVVLPSSLPGILTAALLSIGTHHRRIGGSDLRHGHSY
jgi:phosphate transport system permease protein